MVYFLNLCHKSIETKSRLPDVVNGLSKTLKAIYC